jgi:hypothetical protein
MVDLEFLRVFERSEKLQAKREVISGEEYLKRT